MNRSILNPVTTQLNDHTSSARRIAGELYALAGALSDDLHTMPTKQQIAARQRGLPTPVTFEHDAADVRYALEHAHALRDLLPALVKLSEAVVTHLEELDDHHRRMIDGPMRDELPPDTWS